VAEGVQADPGFAFGGFRAGTELGVRLIGRDLGFGRHNGSLKRKKPETHSSVSGFQEPV
jgi:hypothetical protein